MEFRVSGDWRGRQTRRYSTYSGGRLYPPGGKKELDRLFPDTTLLDKITNLDNPLQKNLGDSHNMDRMNGAKPDKSFCGGRYGSAEHLREVKRTSAIQNNSSNFAQNQHPAPQSRARRGDFFPAFFGITNVITGLFHNIAGAMFQQNRPQTHEKAPDATYAFSQEIYYDSESKMYEKFSDFEQKDSGFEELDEADASPPVGVDEVDAIGNFSRRDCSKNNAKANQNKTHTVLAQLDARGGGGGADISRGTPAPFMEPPADPEAQCRDKMAKIQELLAGKSPDSPRSLTKKSNFGFSRYRHKKVFVEPKAVTVETYRDAFEPESQGRMPCADTTDFVNPGLVAKSNLMQAETLPRVKLEPEIKEEMKIEVPLSADIVQSMEIVKTIAAVPEVNNKSGASIGELSHAQNKYETKVVDEKTCDLRETISHVPDAANIVETKPEVIASCEDKLSKLKALLSQRKKEREQRIAEEQKAIDAKLNSVQSSPKTSAQLPKTITEQPKPFTEATTQTEQVKSKTEPLKTVNDVPKIVTEPQKVKEHEKSTELTQHLIVEPHTTEIQKPLSDISGSDLVQKPDTRRSPERPIPGTNRRHSKHHKNPNRLEARKQRRKQLRRNIVEDARFACEIDPDQLSSSIEDGDSPKIVVSPPKIDENGFDEVRGRFQSNSESDESFVIVFSDSPAASPPVSPRNRLPSDTGSEDSFIICFEDEDGGNSSCFTNEVFSDSESDSDSDCEVGCYDSNLASCGKFSRTIGDLTDESLYAEGSDVKVDSDDEEVDRKTEVQTGLLLTEAKKRARKQLPEKKVRFSTSPPKVHTMHVWLYAAKQARIGNWRQSAADAERFKRRIADADMAISWVLKPQHRNRVKFQRFMPWWNQLRRQEEAERKEKLRLEEERRRLEAERKLKEDEEKLAEEERMLEELERKKKARKKKCTTKEFASNLTGFLTTMKKEQVKTEEFKEIAEDLRVNGVTDANENHS